ncbi:Single-stranded DNA-binding protein DdrA [compost metagenome]
MNRLDEVVGPEGWETTLTPTGVPGAYICALTILGVTKSAIGQAGKSEEEKEKGGDSDALKRAAVQFGIGRYLYDVALEPVDLVRKGDKWILPYGWRPGAPAKGSGASRQRDANVTESTTATESAGAGGVRAPSKFKLFDSKVNALLARARAELGWGPETLAKAVAAWYGAPSIEDLTATEFTDLMDERLAAHAAAHRAKQTKTA